MRWRSILTPRSLTSLLGVIEHSLTFIEETGSAGQKREEK